VGNSTRKGRAPTSRAPKPYEGFPLYAHPLGYWSKKIAGVIRHFGRWGRVVKGELTPVDDYEKGWKDALALFDQQHGAARNGEISETVVQPPKPDSGEPTIALVANKFLTAKKRKVDSRELSPRTFAEYKEATDLLVAEFGKQRKIKTLKPTDFEGLRAVMAKRWGPARLGKFIQMIRSVFGYAAENGIIESVVRFGTEFKRPSKPTFRKHKEQGGKKLFTAPEVRTILAALSGKEVTVVDKSGKIRKHQQPPNTMLRAAVLLAMNAGLGNSDISGLQVQHLEAEPGWINYGRPKTGVPRRVPLWQETVEAIELASAERPASRSNVDAGCVFLNRRGARLVQSTTTSHSDYISKQFGKVLRDLKINGRKNLNFYSIRHTHATIGLETGDRDACRAIMGHEAGDMIAVYDESGPSDERRIAVVEHVREWLFHGTKK
jgi:integrase